MKILLLAGTSEARDLARALADRGHAVTASLAGATRTPRDLGCETRIGGFGGRDGFAQWLDSHPVDAVIDATHPFASRITTRTAQICKARALPYLLVQRAPWPVRSQDRQFEISAAEDALDHVIQGAHVFLATGRQTLASFAVLAECRLYCRQIDPPDAPFPFANGDYVIGRPPFSVEEEIALFSDLRIDTLIVKNSGGAASASKLVAAKTLGLTTLLMRRPAVPDVSVAVDVRQALNWVERHADH